MSERAKGPADSGDADATIVLPTPGRKRSQYAPSLDRQAAAADLARLGGLNPLVEAGNALLAAIPQIRHALRHPDPAALRARLRGQVEGFERSARAAGVAEEPLTMARHALCALLDDSAAATPWGREWAARGLLEELEGEANGGEKFFALLERLMADAKAHLDLLEFFYVCLALGFEGKYRGGEGGRQALMQARTRLLALLAEHRPQVSAELSGRWRGAGVRARRVPGTLALLAAGSLCALTLAALYFVYSISLGALSDPMARDLARLKPPALAGRPAAPAATAPAAPGAVARELAAEIARGEIAVSEAGGASTIVLRSDELFGSGSARPNAALHAVIVRIAEALNKLPGTILVTGHTDDVPIRTARFPSNWELSTERARSVVRLMESTLRGAGRLRAEGVADSEPVAPNDGAANRARNRRVAIVLKTTP